MSEQDKKTHFGFKTVLEEDKSSHVASVFHSVSKNYDLMNDLMSLGLHRLWKKFTFYTSELKVGDKILDIAGGTGDMSIGFKKIVGETGEVWHTDINSSMLKLGRDRILDQGLLVEECLCDAEKLPFKDNYFNGICVSFGLRNMTHKDIALSEMYRVLKPGGVLMVLEFSKIYPPLSKLYNFYSFKILPKLGELIAKDRESYQYLAESIRMHPSQEELSALIKCVGFSNVSYNNLTLGITALHKGYKC